MNKTVKELAVKAEGYWDYGDHIRPTYICFHEDDLVKFAQLIVMECMDNLAWHGHYEAVSQLEWFKTHTLGIK